MRTKLTRLFIEFFDSERASGVILLVSTMTALIIANSLFGEKFSELWQFKAGLDWGLVHLNYDLEHWINDGLMAVFFLLIGLEIEREFYIGELSDIKNASLPIFAALGGMAIPALLHFLFNRGLPTQSGFGIPMATDIAFAVGILALLGSRIPAALKIFLTALAIVDDLGAIIVITLFYAGKLSLVYLGLSFIVFALMVLLNRRGVKSLPAYLIPGVLMWYLMLQSGVHAAIAGVLLAFAIPFADGSETSPSYRLQHTLNKPAAFIIMPLFALANTGILLSGISIKELFTWNTLGIFAGLFIGKPLGIVLFSLFAIRLGLSKLPDGITFKHLVGAGFLGGIGFTMSIFVTFLAFGDSAVAQASKIAVMLGSLFAGMTGLFILSRRFSRFTTRKRHLA
ncbi:MAG: Na+/H+ antiporter NhaA [Chloroflexi bacterium]|nr:MAG: Na+/H+ antiporter NhaA [Chloroflexota bacterium]